jgi:hypothetical protein
MFIATCSIIILLLSLCIPFIAVMVWLVHNLEGYPAFIIAHAYRDAGQSRRRKIMPNGPTMLNTLTNQRSTGALPKRWTAASATPRSHETTKRNKTAAI